MVITITLVKVVKYLKISCEYIHIIPKNPRATAPPIKLPKAEIKIACVACPCFAILWPSITAGILLISPGTAK